MRSLLQTRNAPKTDTELELFDIWNLVFTLKPGIEKNLALNIFLIFRPANVFFKRFEPFLFDQDPGFDETSSFLIEWKEPEVGKTK